MTMRPLLYALLLLATGAATAAADPPSRVGRVSYVEGSLSLFRPDQAQWSPTGINYPVIADDALWSGQGSRAEIQIGATEIRMDELSEIDILRLDESGVLLRVDQGEVNLHLFDVPPGGVQIVTSAGLIELLQPGSYHIDAGRQPAGTPASLVRVGVLEGVARLSGQRTTIDLRNGEGALAGPELSSLSLIAFGPTALDNWSYERMQREMAAQSTAYVSAETTGYQDLAGNGQWTSSPEYGAMWIPTTVAPDWAPYRFGHWAYVSPWGWTWIDDAPWGFAPFHYGRWVEWGGRWAWCPGRIAERPVYAPALVAFIGGGPGLEIDVRHGPGVGWVPLGPHEAFHPYYRASEGYARAVNRAHGDEGRGPHGTNATANSFVNQKAITVVPNNSFVGAESVHRTMVPGGPGQWAHAPVTNNLGHLAPASAPQAAPGPPGQPHPAPGQPGQPHPDRGQPETWAPRGPTPGPTPATTPVPAATPSPTTQQPAPQVRPEAPPQAAPAQRFQPQPAPQSRPEIPPQAAPAQPFQPPRQQPQPVPQQLTPPAMQRPQPQPQAAPHPQERDDRKERNSDKEHDSRL